jgi:hypothetical protein
MTLTPARRPTAYHTRWIPYNDHPTRGKCNGPSPLTPYTIWSSLSRTGAVGVELMLVALQLSSSEALVVTILLVALLIWAFS